MIKLLLKLGMATRTLETVFQGKKASLLEVISYRKFGFFGPKEMSVKKISEYDPSQKVKISA